MKESNSPRKFRGPNDLNEWKEIAVPYEPTILGYTKKRVIYGAQLLTPGQSNAMLAYIEKEGEKLVDEDKIEPTPAEEEAFTAKIKKAKTPKEAGEELKRLFLLMESDPVKERIKKAKTLVRNAVYARLVKERAKYVCEICGTPPFTQRSGIPFAEAHHIYELALPRIDDPNQMLCVCPTCHRVVHYGNDESLSQKIAKTIVPFGLRNGC
jgi:predicted restriction endonuclease